MDECGLVGRLNRVGSGQSAGVCGAGVKGEFGSGGVAGGVVTDALLDLDGLGEEVFVEGLKLGVEGVLGVDCRVLLINYHVKHR
jgi:hypothetical protein